MLALPRIGMIGVGRFGQNHSRILSGFNSCRYPGLYDIDTERSEEIADRDQVIPYSNLFELLDAVDAVVIAVSTSEHYKVARVCLESGKHVLLEKPLTVHTSDAELLINLARDRNLGLFTGHLERFNPGINAAVKAVPSPSFFFAERHGNWQPRSVTANVVYDLMIHDLDILCQLGVSSFSSLSVHCSKRVSDFIDCCDLSFIANTGLKGFITASRCSYQRRRVLRLANNRNIAAVNMISQECQVCDCEKGDGLFTELPIRRRQPLEEELEAFVDFVSGNTSVLPATAIDGLDAMRLANEILAHV